MENIGVQDIIEKLANKDFVVFAGTGCVQGTGIPTWKTLLKELKERCNDYKIRNRNVDKDLNESDYPSFAQRIYDFLSENGRRSEYYETIRQNMQPTECEYTSQHIKIIKCTHKIITTNYDNTFEKAYVDGFNKSNKQGLSTQSLPCLDIKKIHDGNSITYLHGRAFAEDVILKKSDYERFYPSVSKNEINSTMHTTDLLEDFLKQIWKQETMLFIGFSFSDICLLNLFQLFSEKTKQSDIALSEWSTTNQGGMLEHIQHYAFLPNLEMLINSELQNRRTIYESNSIDEKTVKQEIERKTIDLNKSLKIAKIRPVRYSKHIIYQDWLDRIFNKQKKKKSLYQEQK